MILFFQKKFEIEFDLYFDLCWRAEINIQVSRNMHLYVDIGDASSSLWGSTSSYYFKLIFSLCLKFDSIIPYYYSCLQLLWIVFTKFIVVNLQLICLPDACIYHYYYYSEHSALAPPAWPPMVTAPVAWGRKRILPSVTGPSSVGIWATLLTPKQTPLPSPTAGTANALWLFSSLNFAGKEWGFHRVHFG